jgi:hypothetical protein
LITPEEENQRKRELEAERQEKNRYRQMSEAAQAEKARLQQEMAALQRRHVEQLVRDWEKAMADRNRIIGERDALLEQLRAAREGRKTEEVKELERRMARKQKRVRILSERVRLYQKLLERLPRGEVVAAMEALGLSPEAADLLDGQEGEYEEEEDFGGGNSDGEVEMLRPAEEEFGRVEMSAPPELADGAMTPGEIRERAEAIREDFVKNRAKKEAFEALKALERECRERGMGGKARVIIDGVRREIEAIGG